MLKNIRHPFDIRPTSTTTAIAILAAILATSVQAGMFNGLGENAEIRKYDFAYSMQGERKALPGQVFDDGKFTYFQFTHDDVPAIFADDGNGASIAPVKKQGVYLVVTGVHARYMLQLGSVNAAVTYVGSRAISQPETVANKRQHASDTAGLTAPFSNSVRTEMDALDQAKTRRSYPNRIEYAPKEDWGPVLPKNNFHSNLAQYTETKTKFDVPFQAGKDTLGPKGKSVMMQLLGLARSSKKIIIEGGSDGSMGKSSLGLQRGIAMSDWLVKNGVNKDAIYVGEVDGVQSSPQVKIYFSNIIIAERDTRVADASTNQIPIFINYPELADATQQTPIVAPVTPPLLDAAKKTEPKPSWKLETNKTLRDNIDTWAIGAGWNKTQWLASNYYQVTTASTMEGDFTDILRKIADSTKLNICAYKREKTIKITDTNIPCKD